MDYVCKIKRLIFRSLSFIVLLICNICRIVCYDVIKVLNFGYLVCFKII